MANTLDKETVIKQLRSAKNELTVKYPVKSFALFGSVARGDSRKDSDIDILVEFEHPIGMEIVDLVFDLERLLSHKVDLVSKRAVKPEMLRLIEKELTYV